MVRPREHSDDELLDRIAAALVDAPGEWTLAQAARAAGVHSATLIKRFGSRHGVLVALSKKWSTAIPKTPVTGDYLAELRSWAAGVARTPQERSRGVAGVTMLLEDLKDDELSRLLSEGWERQITYLSALVRGARDNGDLVRSPEPTTAAALLLDVVHGSYLRAAASTRLTTATDARTLLEALMESWT